MPATPPRASFLLALRADRDGRHERGVRPLRPGGPRRSVNVRHEAPMSDSVKYVLGEDRIPEAWYNIAADLPEPLPPVLHPGTGEPIGYRRPSGDVENEYGLLLCSPAIADKVIWATRKVWGLN